mmetsp:Transcript_8095/g.17563  ORF Transcript_8095/g.17563 Transcript_8095/m.17563 type:complete len:219 (+) Transcript_8095:543-1199(+)
MTCTPCFNTTSCGAPKIESELSPPLSLAQNVLVSPSASRRARELISVTSARKGIKTVAAGVPCFTASINSRSASPMRTQRCDNIRTVLSEHTPLLTSFKSVANCASAWRYTWVKTTLCGKEAAHDPASKAKRGSPEDTGGNCKKSPQTINCNPPKTLLSSRTMRATCSSLSNNSASIMEISSMTRVRVLRHRITASVFLRIRCTIAGTSSSRPPPPTK